MSHLRRMNLRPPTLAQCREIVFSNELGNRRLLRAIEAERQLTEYGLAYGYWRIAQMFPAPQTEETNDAWQEDERL